MQVKEISNSNLSVWVFFLLAFTITASSYGLRLLIRSHTFLSWVRKLQADVREHSKVRRDRPLRTTFIVRWVWNRSKTVILLLFWALITLLPLIAVWESSLARSIKSVVTAMALLISVLILVFHRLILRAMRSPRNARLLRRTLGSDA